MFWPVSFALLTDCHGCLPHAHLPVLPIFHTISTLSRRDGEEP